MKRVVLGMMMIAMVVACSQQAPAEDFALTALGGYKGGVGFRLAGSVSNFAQGFPVTVEAGVTYTSLDPGRSADVRKVFINDATNGTPEKSGWIWGFHMDFLFQARWLGLPNAQVYLGVRRSLFTGNFVYVGGNEDFDVTAGAWGVGTGLRATFPMSRVIALSLSGGVDYYPNVTLIGHDTSYGPDGQHVNGRAGYTYADADNAVYQPKVQPMLMLGLTYKF